MSRARLLARPAELVAALALGLLAGCGHGERRPSALLVTIDTTRKDAPSVYGRTHPGTTPTIDALAAEGVLYTNARTAAPLTLPAHASMLTGLYPPRHTLRVNGARPLPAAAHTLAEAAREAGAQTAAFVAAVVLAPEFGLDQGFEHYSVPERRNRATSFYDERRAGEVVDDALAWLRSRDRERPFFAWIHLFDPHEPYDPPPGFAEGDERGRLYLGEVSYADQEIGRLLRALREDGTLDETFLLLVADHGEGMGEHEEVSHGDFVYDSTLRVPFLLRYPDGSRAGERSDEIVSVVDVAPTLADALGVELGGSPDGRSLLRGPVPGDRGVYFETYAPWFAYEWSPFSGWVDAQGKYVHSSRPRFFDVAEDPGEEHDLAASADVRRYRSAIAEVASRPALDEAGTTEIDEALRARIRGLGYTGVEAGGRPVPHPLEDGGLPDPGENADLLSVLMRGYALLSAGRYEGSTEAFAEALARDPRNPFALEYQATCLIRLRRFEEAVPLLRRLVAQGRGKASVFFNLGVSLRMLGRDDEARDAFESALEFSPGEPRILQHLEELGGS